MTECTHCRKRYDDSVRFCPVDGFAVAPVAEPWVGRLLMGQFLLKSVCGHGATGTVYQAVQAGMERAVAVKVLRADLLKDPDIVRRFVREARAGAKLNHQNIATVHLVGQTDEGVPFIVMEYVEGLALASVLTIGKPLPLARITHIGTQIASALSEAHSQGIVHRNLKPENILLTERRGEADVVKVVDFGIAKMVAHAAPGEDPISRLGTVFGTPHYIAPEQASGQAVDGRADIYSLGCILYQMATGHVPFEGQAGLQVLLSQVRDPVPDPRQLNPRLADALAELILRMLAKNPAGRPQTAQEVSRLLQLPPSGRATEGRPISGRASQLESVAVEPEHAAFFGPDVHTPPPRSGRDPRRGPGSGNARSRASGRRSGQGERSSRVDSHGPEQDAALRRARLEAADDRPRHSEPAERADRGERADRNDRVDRAFREERTERVRTRAAHHRAAPDDSQDVPVPFLRRYWLPLLGVGGAVTFGLVAGLLYAQWATHPQVAPPAPAPTLLALPQPVPPGRSASAGRSAVPLVKPAVAPTGPKPSSPRLPEVVFPAAPTLTGPHIVQPPTLVPALPAGPLAGTLPPMAPPQPTPPVLAPVPTVSTPAASAPAVAPSPGVTPPPVAPTPAPAAETPSPAGSGAASAPPSAAAEKPAAEKSVPEKPPAADKPAPAEKPAPLPKSPKSRAATRTTGSSNRPAPHCAAPTACADVACLGSLEYCYRMPMNRCRALGHPSRWLLIGQISLVCFGACFGLGCRDLAAKRATKKDAVLAQVDDVAITVSDFEERINSQSPYVRGRYASLDHKKEFLDNLVKFEVLAGEARRLGLDKDPEVVRTMKQVMIQKLLKQQIDRFKAEDIPDADLAAYFTAHQDEYNRPPEVRVSMILVPDEATANKVLADPRAKGIENLGFRELVTQYSTDQETKDRGGDLRFFDAQNRELPAELVAAAFKLVNVGDTSPAIKTARGYAVLKLTGQRRALVRTLLEVSPQIRAKLFRERRQKLMDDYEQQVRKRSRVAVNDAQLSQVHVDLSGAVGAPDDLRPQKGTGSYHPIGQDVPQASPARPSAPAAPAIAAPSPAANPSPAKP